MPPSTTAPQQTSSGFSSEDELNTHPPSSVEDKGNSKDVTQYRDNADLILDMTLDVHSSSTPECVNGQIWNIVSILCPFLHHGKEEKNDAIAMHDSTTTLPPSSLTIKPLTGGLSNELFIVQTSYSPQGVLVRIHPSTSSSSDDEDYDDDEEAAFIDRDIENKLVAWLSSQNIGPTYYGRFNNGRVEEFYSNVKPLSCHEMSKYAISIATNLATFHSLDVPTTIMGPKPTSLEQTCRFNSIDNWFTSVFNKLDKKKKEEEEVSTSNTEEKKNDDTDGDNDNDDDIIELSKELYKEWMWLKESLLQEGEGDVGGGGGSSDDSTTTNAIKSKALQFIREIVLTHQDCQSLNILKKDTTTSADKNTSSTEDLEDSLDVKLIDFEYAGYNARSADIANTFCEYCDMNNLCAKYESEYPTEYDQNIFLKTYVKQVDPKLANEIFNSSNDEDETSSTEEKIFLSTLRQEIGRFTLLSHLGWAIWGILKKLEDCVIEYDYIEYTRHRMDGYKLFKSLFCTTNTNTTHTT